MSSLVNMSDADLRKLGSEIVHEFSYTYGSRYYIEHFKLLFPEKYSGWSKDKEDVRKKLNRVLNGQIVDREMIEDAQRVLEYLQDGDSIRKKYAA